ncbi:MAG: PDZ domain-containing protein, partial [candidate division Zixibacteria bacterium]|nr:PDZ domain-containing protein [candidate division Zixibacteria bacterium]
MSDAVIKKHSKYAATLLVALIGLGWMAPTAQSQEFDFERLQKRVRTYTVVIDMDLDLAFGIHSSEQKERYIATIVTEDGLIIFNGSDLAGGGVIGGMPGVNVSVTPRRIEVSTLDGATYDAEYLGVDRYTGIGFVKATADTSLEFEPIKFKTRRRFEVGEWLALYMLLPEFISPPLTADIGMVSSVVASPESFPLTVGFNSFQMTSVLFDEDLEPVGVLGMLVDPARASLEANGLMEALGQFGMPLLGVISGDRLAKVIAEPPTASGGERGWLGIRLQALTAELAEYWQLETGGGIIVNETVKGSPADKAGLQVGDVIVSVNGGPVDVDREENISIFQRRISELGPEASVEMMILRPANGDSDTLTLLATLDEAPIGATDAEEYESTPLEFTVRNLVFDDYFFLNQDAET